MYTATNDNESVRAKPAVPKGKKAAAKIGKTMSEFAAGDLKSGGSGATVTSKKQAVAIALSQARKAAAK